MVSWNQVVICFHFSIFANSKQQHGVYNDVNKVVICFHFSIFANSKQLIICNGLYLSCLCEYLENKNQW